MKMYYGSTVYLQQQIVFKQMW